MLRSLVSGFAGLKTHVQGMDVVGNNISNVNTVGYKEGRATFQDVLSQTLSSANSSTSSLTGGKNATQIGLGATLASVDNIFSQGGLDSTNNQNDLAINGGGFFTLKNGDRSLYTRAGNFSFDVNGNYVNPNGLFVQGWTDVDPVSGAIRTGGPLQNVILPQGMSIPAKATSSIEISGKIDSGVSIGSTLSTKMGVYDSLGGEAKIWLNLNKTATNIWDWSVSSASSGSATGSGTLVFTDKGILSSGGNFSFTFDPTSGASTGQVVNVDLTGGTSVNNSGLTQFDSDVPILISNTKTDGYAAGELQNYLIDFNGTIRAFFSNDETREVAKIALTTFTNENGLMKAGDNLYIASANSGTGVVGESGTGTRGKIQPSSLEFSNVDLAAQFTKMIILQRGFQANAKTITTSDEMLQTLMTLKR